MFQLRQMVYSGRIKHTTVDTLIKPLAIYMEHLCALPIADVFHTIHSSIGNEVISMNLICCDGKFIVSFISVNFTSLPFIARTS